MTTNFDFSEEKKILSWLEQNIGFENYQNAIDRGLSRIRPLFAKHLKENKAQVATIAGTNGKGETCLLIAEHLRSLKKTYTLWTSPHVLSIRERFRSSEGMISYEELWQKFKEVEAIQKKENIILSFYEFLFFCFVKWSAEKSPGYMVLEVGLGGRLDATNLFDAKVTGLTSVGRDHQAFLGNKLELILQEKLFISRPAHLMFTCLESRYLRDKAKVWGLKQGVFISDLFESQVIGPEDSFSTRNQKLAKLVIKELTGEKPIDDIYIERFPKISYGKMTLSFNGAHNPAAMRSLMHSFCKEQKSFDWVLVAFSKRSLRDIQTMLTTLLAYTSKIGKIYLTSFDNWKAASLAELGFEMDTGSYEIVTDWKSFLESEKNKKAQVLISGSNYFLGDVHHFMYQRSSSSCKRETAV